MTNAKRTQQKNDWQKAHVDRINLTVPKGQKEIIRDHAQARGESVNGFINRAIDEAMERNIIIGHGKERVEALAKRYNVSLDKQEMEKLIAAFSVLEPHIPRIKELYFSERQSNSAGPMIAVGGHQN